MINERTGTIVATSTVRISEVAVADGSLTITISSNMGVSQPSPLSQGTTTPVQSTQTSGTEDQGQPDRHQRASDDRAACSALNSLGVSTREMMAIFQTLKRAGALQADLVIN